MMPLLIILLNLAPLPALGQSSFSRDDMTLPKMTKAQLTRADVVTRLDPSSAFLTNTIS